MAHVVVEGLTWLLPALLVLSGVLGAATAIDLEHRIIPNRLTYRLPLVLLALLGPPTLWGPGGPVDLARGLLAAIVVPGGLLAVSEGYRLLRGRVGFGLGDIKLLVSLGLVTGYLGWMQVAVLLYGAVLSSLAVAVALMAAGRVRLASRIPFGPHLAAGALVAVLATDPIRAAVGGLFGP